MTTLVYTYRHTPDDGAELRYSLRSVAQNFHPQDGTLDLMVVGDRPTWLSGPVQFIEGNPTEFKAYNMLWNMAEACKNLPATSRPIYCADDYVLLEPVTSVALGHRTFTIDQHVKKVRREEPGSSYCLGIEATAFYVRNRPGKNNDWSWELHRPFPLIAGCVEPALRQLVNSEPVSIMPWWRTVYGTGIPKADAGWPMDDPWTAKGYRPWGASWISLGDGAWRHYSKRLRGWFSQPSPWEGT